MGWTTNGARALNQTLDGISLSALVNRAAQSLEATKIPPASALQHVEWLAAIVRREQPALSHSDALTIVLSTNRELYDRYRAEQETGTPHAAYAKAHTPAPAQTSAVKAPTRAAGHALTAAERTLVDRAMADLDEYAHACRGQKVRSPKTLSDCIRELAPDLTPDEARALSAAALGLAPLRAVYDGSSVRDVDHPERMRPSVAVPNRVDVVARLRADAVALRQQNPLLSEEAAVAEIFRNDPKRYREYCAAVQIPVR